MTTFVLNFPERFAHAVATGEKLQSIRLTRKDGRLPLLTHPIKLYAGLRSKSSRLLKESTVTAVFPVWIRLPTLQKYGQVHLGGGKILSAGELQAFARADGFTDSTAFFQFFRKSAGAAATTLECFCVRWHP